MLNKTYLEPELKKNIYISGTGKPKKIITQKVLGINSIREVVKCTVACNLTTSSDVYY